MDDPFLHLSDCNDTTEVLDILLNESKRRQLGIKAIRYYRLVQLGGQEYLESVDCAGHVDPIPTQLRAGRIERLRRRLGSQSLDAILDVIDNPQSSPIAFRSEEHTSELQSQF